METPEGNSRRAWPGPRHGPGSQGSRGTAGGTRATVLGSLTIPGRPEQVAAARAFVARTLSSHQIGADTDAATLLTSEIVTNAIQHTKSGVDDGSVTIVVIRVPHGVLVEVIDDGAAGPRSSRVTSMPPTGTACTWSSTSPPSGDTSGIRTAPRSGSTFPRPTGRN